MIYRSRAIAGFDLDSTLYDTGHRQPMIQEFRDAGLEPDWPAYSQACSGDTVVEAVAVVARALSATMDIHIISARHESAYTQTLARLTEDGVPFDGVWLDNGQHDHIPHSEYKLARVREVEEATGQKVAIFFEDWANVAHLLNSNGIPTVALRTPQEVAQLVAEGLKEHGGV